MSELASGTTSRSGEISASAPVPADATLGDHTVTATGQASGRTASAPVAVAGQRAVGVGAPQRVVMLSTPVRVLDTRTTGGGPVKPQSPLHWATELDDSAGATAWVANITVTNTQAAGHLRVWPADQPMPLASTLNWAAGETVANQGIFALSAGGALAVFNGSDGTADVVIDLVGWLVP